MRALSVLLALLLCAVGISEVTFTDSLSKTVTLEHSPKRVAVLFSSYAEMWLDAGGEIAVSVGESIERGFAAPDTPIVDAGAGKSINTELLISLKPDFVICSADVPAQVEAATLLNAAGIASMCFKVESLEDYLNVFSVMTQITENASAFKEKGEQVALKAEQIISESAIDGSTYAFIRTGSSSSSTKLKQSSEHFACGMLNAFGLVNIADSGFIASGNVNIEALIALNPDYLFISIMGDEDAGTAYALDMLSKPEWQALNCVKNGHVSLLPKEYFHYKPNSRWADAYGYLADILSR